MWDLEVSFHSIASSRERALVVLGQQAGYIRDRDLREAGIDPHVLSALVAEGELERVRRGLYRCAGSWSEQTPLADVAVAAPNGVLCLLSALAYYGLTTTTPSDVYLAIPRKARPPHIDYPPVRVVRYGERMFSYGIMMQPLADSHISVRMYSREKTIADALHFADIVGRDIAIESLKEYLRQAARSVDDLLAAAAVCRVEPQMISYLEMAL